MRKDIKLDATYICSSYSNIIDLKTIEHSPFQLTPRIMYNILENQKNLNIIYSSIPLISIISYYQYSINKEKNNFNPRLDYWKSFYEETIDLVETNYVLLTLGTSWELFLLSLLLQKGKKVVVGGPLTKLYNLKTLRKIFEVNGATNLDNVIIVRPYISKSINLYNVIKDWKDIDIDVKFDTSDILISDFNRDFYLDYMPVLKKEGIYYGRFPIMFQTDCYWGKCSFCKYTSMDNKFASEKNIDLLSDHILTVSKKYNSNVIHIADPEFYFTKISKRFLENMRLNDYSVSFFSSVRLLKNETYWNNVKYYSDIISDIHIGFESFDDFSLKVLNKGATCKDNFEVIFKIIEFNLNQKNKIGVNSLFIGDLITDSKESAIKNHKNINLFKDLMNKSDTPFNFYYTKYRVTPLTKYNYHPLIDIKGHPLEFFNDYDRIGLDGKVIPNDNMLLKENL